MNWRAILRVAATLAVAGGFLAGCGGPISILTISNHGATFTAPIANGMTHAFDNVQLADVADLSVAAPVSQMSIQGNGPRHLFVFDWSIATDDTPGALPPWIAGYTPVHYASLS